MLRPESQHSLALAPSCLQVEVEQLLNHSQDTDIKQNNKTSLKLSIFLVDSGMFYTDITPSKAGVIYSKVLDSRAKFWAGLYSE